MSDINIDCEFNFLKYEGQTYLLKEDVDKMLNDITVQAQVKFKEKQKRIDELERHEERARELGNADAYKIDELEKKLEKAVSLLCSANDYVGYAMDTAMEDDEYESAENLSDDIRKTLKELRGVK